MIWDLVVVGSFFAVLDRRRFGCHYFAQLEGDKTERQHSTTIRRWYAGLGGLIHAIITIIFK